MRKHAGETMSVEDTEAWYSYRYDMENARLKQIIDGPAPGLFKKVMDECYLLKRKCYYNPYCSGWNESTLDGILEWCGKIDPFKPWDMHIDNKKYDEALDIFIDQYNPEIFTFMGSKSTMTDRR